MSTASSAENAHGFLMVDCAALIHPTTGAVGRMSAALSAENADGFLARGNDALIHPTTGAVGRMSAASSAENADGFLERGKDGGLRCADPPYDRRCRADERSVIRRERGRFPCARQGWWIALR
jgi:hypothetical protein